MELTIILEFSLGIKISKEEQEEYKRMFYKTDDSFLTKMNTTRLIVEEDRKDPRLISGLKNIKITFKPTKEFKECFILWGDLFFNFKRDIFKPTLFVRKIIKDSNLNFESIKGPEVELNFNPIATDELEEFERKLEAIKENEEFEFNIEQFSEFLEIFEFYKKIANELNNDTNFSIINNQINSYYFAPVGIKDIDLTFSKKIYNEDKIIVGYKFSKNSWQNLSDEEQEKCTEVINLEIQGTETDLKKIKIFNHNDGFYVSQQEKIENLDPRLCIQVNLINSIFQSKIIQKKIERKTKKGEVETVYESINKNLLVLTISTEKLDALKTMFLTRNQCYLNLYDLGQRIKIETIDSSIREILKGATSNATELLEYVVGGSTLPNDSWQRELNLKNKEKYLTNLDESQKAAFLMATDGNPISLIKGPPGTGKTHVIQAIINYLVREQKEKILVSSQTHVAIDNVIDKIMEGSNMIIPKRITNRKNKYDVNYLDKTLFNIWNNNIHQFLEHSSNQELSDKILDNLNNFKGERLFDYSANAGEVQVIGVTTTASQTAGKKGYTLLKDFDWLIIDEVSKCPITEILRYLPYVKRIIMVGDDYQLAPLLEFNKNEVKNLESYDEEKFDRLEKIYQESVFASLYAKAEKEKRVVQLNNNYRSVKQILNVYNVFYKNQLQNKREDVNSQKVLFKNEEKNKLLNSNDVLFVEVTGGSEINEGTSRYNVQELMATKEYLTRILEEIENPEKITVAAIFPYAAQIKKFSQENRILINEARETFKSFEMDTVDAFQGREADIVLVNTVVTDASKRNFLSDFRRINVALSRSRDKLVIFGNSIVLSKIDMQINNQPMHRYFKDIIDYIKLKTEGFIEY